jgi:2-oxoglutarate dehydrogenase complex dehydrogenase (E1) component-like enzyme
MQLQEFLPEGNKLVYCGRPASPATATGSMKVHLAEQSSILNDVMGY